MELSRGSEDRVILVEVEYPGLEDVVRKECLDPYHQSSNCHHIYIRRESRNQAG